MKKQITKIAFIAAIAMVCGICIIGSQKSESLSDVALANIEALASAGNITLVCEPHPNSECHDLIVTPSGNNSIVYLNMISKIL